MSFHEMLRSYEPDSASAHFHVRKFTSSHAQLTPHTNSASRRCWNKTSSRKKSIKHKRTTQLFLALFQIFLSLCFALNSHLSSIFNKFSMCKKAFRREGRKLFQQNFMIRKRFYLFSIKPCLTEGPGLAGALSGAVLIPTRPIWTTITKTNGGSNFIHRSP